MVEVFDEAAARRERFRTATGQFGAVPLHPPEMSLHTVPAPPAVTKLYSETDTAREYLAFKLLDEIDAAMPREADFVNYEMNNTGTHLIISEAIGGYGEELDLKPFSHIDEVLVQLGQPYGDFDGDLVINSVDDYGWERSQPYSAERDAEARQVGNDARAQWRKAIIAQQRTAIEAIWPLVDPAVQALDFSWNDEGQCMRLAAVIHPDGRTDVNGENWPRANALAAYVTEPQFTPMLRNDLSGLYRLTRGS